MWQGTGNRGWWRDCREKVYFTTDLLSRHARILSKLDDSVGEGRRGASYRVLHEAASHRPSLPVSSLRNLAEGEITIPFRPLVFALFGLLRALRSIILTTSFICDETLMSAWGQSVSAFGENKATPRTDVANNTHIHCTCLYMSLSIPYIFYISQFRVYSMNFKCIIK